MYFFCSREVSWRRIFLEEKGRFSLAGGGFATTAWPLPHRRRFYSTVHDGFAPPPSLPYRILGEGFTDLSSSPLGRPAAVANYPDQRPTFPTIVPNCAEVGAAPPARSSLATGDCPNSGSSRATLRAPPAPRAPISDARPALPAPARPAHLLPRSRNCCRLLDAGTDYDPLLHWIGHATPQGLASHCGLPDFGPTGQNAAPFRVSLFLSILSFACSIAGD